MNILDYIEQQEDVQKIEFTFNDKDIKCYIKNLSQAEIEEIGSNEVDLGPLLKKQENGGKLTKEEAKKILGYQSRQVFQVLVDKHGNRIFDDIEVFKKKIKGSFFKTLCNEILENPLEVAEKN